MTYSIRPAHRSEAKPLIGLYSESGAGKTWSALLLARGFVGPTGTIVQIETESGRGEAYADLLPGGYQVLSMRDEFSPVHFGEAISAAEKADADALILDSASHEWEATGGVLSMAAANQAANMKGVLVWQQPKLEHARHFVLRLLSTPIPLVIVCMRARYPMEQHPQTKEWTRSPQLVPYQSDTFLFELFAHGWIDREHRFHGTKYSRDDLRSVLRDNEPISLETGQRLAAWAKSGGAPVPQEPSARLPPSPPPVPVRPTDECLAILLRATEVRRAELWDEIRHYWSQYTRDDQKRLLEGHARAKARLAG